jgi:hypothetical protein
VVDGLHIGNRTMKPLVTAFKWDREGLVGIS